MFFDHSVLVTGASGFLGGVVMARLQSLGSRVVGTTHAFFPGRSDLVEVNLEDSDSLSRLNRWGPFDAVLHFAAVLPGRRGDLETLIANECMTYNLGKWTVEQKIGKFIYASGCNVYGLRADPCSEATVSQPHNFYAVSKLACENLLNVVVGETNTELCVLRISAPYGPNMVADTVVTLFLKRVSQGLPLELMGSGKRSQDFVYQEDVASAFVLALQRRATGLFNISSGRPVSMRELAETVLEVFGRPFAGNILNLGADPQEYYRGSFLTQAAVDSFGYEAKVGLKQGLRKTAEGLGLLKG